MDQLPGPQVAIVRRRVIDGPRLDSPNLFRREREAERRYDLTRQFLLDLEYVVEGAAVLLCPQVRVPRAIDQLRGYAERIARPAHRPSRT